MWTTETGRPLAGAVALAAVCVLACACVVGIPLKESHVEAQLPETVAPIVVGQTDRAAVRQVLGEPWLTSDYWRFDVFRRSDKNVTAGVGFIFWWPVPLGIYTDTVSAYVLVSYDSSGTVAGYDKGIPESLPLTRDFSSRSDQSLRLNAMGISFVVAGRDNRLEVVVSPTRRDAYLGGQLPDDQCLLLVRCPYGNCGEFAALEVDAVRSQLLPLPMVPGGLLYPEWVTSGNHRLQVRTPLWMREDPVMATGQISCEGGDVQYVLLPDYGSRATREPIRVTPERPEPSREEPLLVWCDGKWLVPGP